MVSFEDWWYKYEYVDPVVLFGGPDTDVRAAYIAGFNACRDKWGGLTYEQTMGDEE